MKEELKLLQDQLSDVVEAKRDLQEQLLRANEVIAILSKAKIVLEDKVTAYELFYHERDLERMNLLKTHEELKVKAAAAEEISRTASKELKKYEFRSDKLKEPTSSKV